MKKDDKAAQSLLQKTGQGQKYRPQTKEDEKSLNDLLLDMMKSAGGSESDIQSAIDILRRK